MSQLVPEPNRRGPHEEFRRGCAAQPRGRYERVDGQPDALVNCGEPMADNAEAAQPGGGGEAAFAGYGVVLNGPITLDTPGITITVGELGGAQT